MSKLERIVRCRNKRCSLFDIIFDTTRANCAVCGGRLKVWAQSPGDTPIGIDDAPPAGSPLPVDAAFRNGTVTAPDDEPAVFQSACDVESCSVAPRGKIHIPFTLYNIWLFLCHKFPVEWIAYLKGTQDETTHEITLAEDGMYFPVQRANGIHVDAETCSVLDGTIASIHSHVAMAAFFSKEDRDHFNHPADLVINREGTIDCVMRHKLDCGRFIRSKSEILIEGSTADIGMASLLRSKLTIDRTPTSSTSQDHDTRWNSRSAGFRASSPAQGSLTVIDNRHHSRQPTTFGGGPRRDTLLLSAGDSTEGRNYFDDLRDGASAADTNPD